jgi:hypothetical protein
VGAATAGGRIGSSTGSGGRRGTARRTQRPVEDAAAHGSLGGQTRRGDQNVLGHGQRDPPD